LIDDLIKECLMRTSQDHPLRIGEVRLPHVAGRIGITFCPGKKGESFTGPDWDRDMGLDLDRVVLWKATNVVTLLEDHEFAMLGVHDLGRQVERRGMKWHHLPIVAGSPPDARFNVLWAKLKASLVEDIRNGEHVLVHCRGGLGRAGTVATLLLIELGVRWADALAMVRAIRPGAVETIAQEEFIARYQPERSGEFGGRPACKSAAVEKHGTEVPSYELLSVCDFAKQMNVSCQTVLEEEVAGRIMSVLPPTGSGARCFPRFQLSSRLRRGLHQEAIAMYRSHGLDMTLYWDFLRTRQEAFGGDTALDFLLDLIPNPSPHGVGTQEAERLFLELAQEDLHRATS
jgi:protein-tyrosine phosphatase